MMVCFFIIILNFLKQFTTIGIEYLSNVILLDVWYTSNQLRRSLILIAAFYEEFYPIGLLSSFGIQKWIFIGQTMWTNIILVKTIFGKLFGGYLSNIQFSFSTKIIKTDIPNVIIMFISAWDCSLVNFLCETLQHHYFSFYYILTIFYYNTLYISQ